MSENRYLPGMEPESAGETGGAGEESVLDKMSDLELRLYRKIEKNPDGEYLSLETLANEVRESPSNVRRALASVRKLTGIYVELDDSMHVPAAFKEDIRRAGKRKVIPVNVDSYFSHRMIFGATADTHIASHYFTGHGARRGQGPLHNFYRVCADQGVTHVFHGGNWLEGAARFNKHEVTSQGFTKQLTQFMHEYPFHPNIVTVIICGDDHEGWWQQREGIDIAETAAMKAAAEGRYDLHFIGYLEADIAIVPGRGFVYNKYEVGPRPDETGEQFRQRREREREATQEFVKERVRKTPEGEEYLVTSPIEPWYLQPEVERLNLPQDGKYAIMRLSHGGGGTAYAKSLRSQKKVETLEGGEKPQIDLVGHYHKAISDYERNVHIVQMGTTKKQDPFMRKRNILAEVGNYIIEINQDADTGIINRFAARWIPFIGRGFVFNPKEYGMH